MATIILGAVGRAVGGPLGGIAGTLAGGFVDRAVFSGFGSARDVGRLANPVVQSSAYGEAIAFVYGRMRVAGNVIWSSGIAERIDALGGGKGGAATNQYRYTSSFAVGLAARRIVGIGRVWADGRLIRAADGGWNLPVQMRLHMGSERQLADPLIAAAEGDGAAPAYRGLAYVVFEDLALADFGNRIPNLSFEIIADAGSDLDFGKAAVALAADASEASCSLSISGDFPALAGFFAARPGPLAANLQPIVEATWAGVTDHDGLLSLQRLRKDMAPDCSLDAVYDCQAKAEAPDLGSKQPTDRQMLRGESGPDSVEIGHYDVDRDYLAGLQRVRRSAGSRVVQLVLPAAMDSVAAKALASNVLIQSRSERLTRIVRLPWRHIGLLPAMLVRISDSDALWRVREQRFEKFVVTLSLERVSFSTAASILGDGGRVQRFDDGPVGPTTLVAVELPGLGGGAATVPQVHVFAAGETSRWRRAGVELSMDGGVSFSLAGAVGLPCVMGQLMAPTMPGKTAGWDDYATLEVELLAPEMWIESASPEAVLQGANLALVGTELLQFSQVEAVSPRRFRLRKLLRGRFGTEAAVVAHAASTRFLMVQPSFPLEIPLPSDAVGRAIDFRAAGAGDDGTSVETLELSGRGLRPLSPVHLSLKRDGNDVLASWTRRSRIGFAWLDFADAPLGEEVEKYEVIVRLDGALRRRVVVVTTKFSYGASDYLADGGGSLLQIEVAQISAAIGPGEAATAAIVMG